MARTPSRDDELPPTVSSRLQHAAVLLTLLMIALLAWSSWNLVEAQRRTEAGALELDGLARLAVLDDRLSWSARSYALTGERRWAEEYEQAEGEMEETLGTLATRGSRAAQRFALRLRAANDTLVPYEREALELTRAGRRDEAVALLSSRSYVQHTDHLQETIAGFTVRVRDDLAAKRAGDNRRLLLTLVLGLIGLLGLLALWLHAFQLIRQQMSTHSAAAERARELAREQAARTAAEAGERRTREILESITDAFVSFAPDWTVTYANSRVEELVGMPRDKLLGRQIWAALPPAVEARLRPIGDQVLSEGKPRTLEAPSILRPGRWFQFRMYPSPEGISVYIDDITERKRAEQIARFNGAIGAAITHPDQPLEASLQQCAQALVDHLDAAFARIWTLNDAEQMLELEASAGMYTHRDGPHARVPMGAYKIGRIAQERTPHLGNDVQHGASVGDDEWARREGMIGFAGYPLEVGGQVVGVIAMFSRFEIPEAMLDALAPAAQSVASAIQRKWAERQLRDSELTLRTVLNASPDLIEMLDSAGRFRWVSYASREILGYEPESLSGTRMVELIHPDDRGAVDEKLRSIFLRPSDTFQARFRAAHRAGHWVPLEAHGRVDDEGRLVLVVRDVSGQVELEEELHTSKRRAEAASEAKSAFLSRMSHELRTPLNAILGFGQLLELDVLKTDNVESVEQILRAGRHLLGLIDEVLDLASVEANRLPLSVEPVALGEAVEYSMSLVRQMAAERNITILHNGSADGLYVRADLQRLRQVILNLLSNAIKYNREGGHIQIGVRPENRGEIALLIRDDGHGIPAAAMNRLFVPFDRLGAERLGVEGTGLGLPLSKGLVEAMRGRLEAESVEGEGSTFRVVLPRAEAPEEAASLGRLLPRQPAGGAVPAAQSRTVLFIEDNLANVRLVERVLQRRPAVRLLTAMQGMLGIEMARDHLPDLILLDRNLPDIAGDEVLRRIRQEAALRRTPVVMLSGDAMPEQIDRLLSAGADGYLTKPFEIVEFLRIVDDALARNGLQTQQADRELQA